MARERTSLLCGSKELVRASTAAVVKLRVAAGDGQGRKGDNQGFYAQRPPAISVEAYVARLVKYMFCSNSCFIVALRYLERVCKRYGELALSSHNVHRLLVVACVLATKLNDDTFYTNLYYAKVAGISVSELNLLELEFLKACDFRLHVTPEEFFETERKMVADIFCGPAEHCTEAIYALISPRMEGLNLEPCVELELQLPISKTTEDQVVKALAAVLDLEDNLPDVEDGRGNFIGCSSETLRSAVLRCLDSERENI